MLTFAQGVQHADSKGMPAVEGFAVKLEDDPPADGVKAAVTAELEKRLPGYGWRAVLQASDWLTISSESAHDEEPPALGEAWQAARDLAKLPGVASAEPLLLIRMPVASAAEAERAFGLWGKVSDDRLAQIQAESGPQNRHWSLVKLGVCDAQGANGAWKIWRDTHGAEKEPGDGIVVAHPDTGYTPHPRLQPRLLPNPGSGSPLYGRNFVERTQADALDPLRDRSIGNFPGHGTGTASVIAAGGGDPGLPWGVAPGARILPLRVSSSVIHLSFKNVCDAFVEAMNRGAHVISMSLGGPIGSGLLNTLVRQALDQGIIVVSAAGNNAPTVVFPALIPGVLGCAASNALSSPWRFSGLGAAVAITAPGELVWHDSVRVDSAGAPVYEQVNGSGTSFATANVAGLAALWLSYHGRAQLLERYHGRKELLPFVFRLCLQRSADPSPKFIRDRKGGFGAGIARADQLLLEGLPGEEEVAKLRKRILAGEPDGIVKFPVSSWWTILTLPTLAADGLAFPADEVSAGERSERLESFLVGDEGLVPGGSGGLDDTDRAEIGALAAIDVLLSKALMKVAEGARGCVSSSAVRRYLLSRKDGLSPALAAKLLRARDAARTAWCEKHPELCRNNAPLSAQETGKGDDKPESRATTHAYAVAPPQTRRLRAFAFDPSLATQSADAAVNEITIPVFFEHGLKPGPIGDYLEVVDVDPASDCAYAPVDLDHPFLLAQDGLPRSEGNPQFHQQMVYAVAMKTISHFEEALGRPIFWSPLRPWNGQSGDDKRAREATREVTKEGGKKTIVKDPSDQFVQRLRLFPHALREQNAYYSPQKRAILFGYFPAGDGDPGAEYPGGLVFTCLAHDIIAHEMTHAILDGMHVHFIEPTNPDVFAFHEAFADIVALFQRFTYQELLRDQLAKARGHLDAGTLMTRLALQFGQATGRHQALRDALGYVVRQARTRGAAEWRDLRDEREPDGGKEPPVTIADTARVFDDATRHLWKRFQANPWLLAEVEEPHARGSFLVAAVFDAYLRIYEDRVADLRRIATGGSGVLPDGDLHPDLVNRMANEAAKSARHVLRMCIRAMDYVPPTDITFGEFLRALITADSDLVPDDDRRYRVAFIEAFRKWGIYPRDVRTLSEESLRWSSPEESEMKIPPKIGDVLKTLFEWQPGKSRKKIFEAIKKSQALVHSYLEEMPENEVKWKLLGGIDTRQSFQVTNLRPARRIGPKGEFLTEMVVEILQSQDALPSDKEEKRLESNRRSAAKQERKERGIEEEPQSFPFRGGVTLIIGVEQDQYWVRYAIFKRLDSTARKARQRDFLLRAGAGGSEAAEYSSEGLPDGWFSDETVRAKWLAGRTDDREDMRASSCSCRRTRMDPTKGEGRNEPFALLHRF